MQNILKVHQKAAFWMHLAMPSKRERALCVVQGAGCRHGGDGRQSTLSHTHLQTGRSQKSSNPQVWQGKQKSQRACQGRWENPRQNPYRQPIGLIFLCLEAFYLPQCVSVLSWPCSWVGAKHQQKSSLSLHQDQYPHFQQAVKPSSR